MVHDLGASHLSDEQLQLYRDGELAADDVVHLQTCGVCSGRLHEMDEAMAAYVEYRQVVQAMRPMPPRSWASLDVLIARDAESGRSKIVRWWPRLAVAAAGCALVAALVWRQNAEQPAIRASELLARSARVTAPQSRKIAFRVGGRIFVRPAILTTDATPESDVAARHLRSLFVAAHYSWRDPLSARSFQEWRSGLRQKRDSVSVIRKQAQESFRVRTDSAVGVLQSASITLRAVDLYPTDARFAFAGESALDVSDAPTASTPEPVPTRPGAQREAGKEIPASPEDTLHVLAALDAIGADVEDPIEISEDSEHRHVVVRGSGVAPERRRLIADALKPLAHVIVQFDAGTPAADASQTAYASSAHRTSSDIPPDFRRQLEERFGGAVPLQQITDRALDTIASIVARAHALDMLASKFPPEIAGQIPERDRDVLRKLQRHHAGELQRLFARMQGDLQPLLTAAKTPAQPAAKWQSTAPELLAAAKAADDLLNHLLAGSYTQASGSEMLLKISSEIDRLGAAIQAQGPK